MRFNLFRAVMILVSTAVAIHFESAAQQREIILVTFAVLLSATAFLRGKKHNRMPWTLYMDVGIVFALNAYSRFGINHLFILLNLWILVEAALYQSFNNGVAVISFSMLGVGVALAQLLAYDLQFQTLTQAGFVIVVFLLFVVMLVLYKSYMKERNEVNRLNGRLLEQNDTLIKINGDLVRSKEALESANIEVAKLTRVKERSQMAQDLHDTVGHELTGLIMSLEMLKLKCRSEEDEMLKVDLQSAITQSREILRAMRDLVSSHKDAITLDNLHDALTKKLYKYQANTGIMAHLTYNLDDHAMDDVTAQVLYRCIIESITNTAKHGKAKHVWVSFQSLIDQGMLLKIFDDGTCPKEFVKGNGLLFIEERIKRLNGTATFESGELGFNTRIQLPSRHLGKEAEGETE